MFVQSAADCTYAFAISLIYADASVAYTPKAVKTNMPKLKKSYLDTIAAGDIVEVTPDPTGLKAAKDAIAEGKAIRLNGSSGVFLFDDAGDRLAQAYKVLKPTLQASTYSWLRVSVYNGDNGECEEGCTK